MFGPDEMQNVILIGVVLASLICYAVVGLENAHKIDSARREELNRHYEASRLLRLEAQRQAQREQARIQAEREQARINALPASDITLTDWQSEGF